MRYRYTEEELSFIRENGADMTTAELHKALSMRFGERHTPDSVRTVCKNLGVRKSGDAIRRARKRPRYEIGDERLVGNYWYVKVSDVDGFYNAWKPKHLLLWEAAHGSVPSGSMVVFLDGNSVNATLENLACISKRVAAKMVNGHGRSLWSENREITKVGIAVCELELIAKKYTQEAKNG